MEVSITQLAHLDAFLATVLKCSKRRETCIRYSQQVNLHMFICHVGKVVDQFAAQVRKPVQICESEAVVLSSKLPKSDSK